MQKLLFITLGLFVLFIIAYGFDREMTREIYQEYAENQDFEKTITGCKFQSNCDYYNNLLWTAVE